MDFDTSKENIQPLRGGRNVSQLGVALQAQQSIEYQEELLRQKQEFETAIRMYVGEDPLEIYYQYISWVEQSYPKHGHEGNLVPLLEDCLKKFENDNRYINDRRYCKLWIKFNDMQTNPIELYQMLYSRGIGKGCADLYKAWAFYHEAAGDYRSADMVFQTGRKEFAQPYQDLCNAHESMVYAAGQQLINGVDERRLFEQRQALTMLRPYRSGRVGSVRVGSLSTPSVLPATSSGYKSNVPVQIYQDHEEMVLGAAAPPISVLSAVKRDSVKENLMKAGTWTSSGSRRGQQSNSHRTLSFQVHVDSNVPPEVQGIRLSPNFSHISLEDLTHWKSDICVPDPDDPSKIPMYCKKQVYVDPSTEYSIEEVRARRYLRKNKSRLSIPYMETEQAIQSIIGIDQMDHSMQEMETITFQDQLEGDVIQHHHSEPMMQNQDRDMNVSKNAVANNSTQPHATFEPEVMLPQHTSSYIQQNRQQSLQSLLEIKSPHQLQQNPSRQSYLYKNCNEVIGSSPIALIPENKAWTQINFIQSPSQPCTSTYQEDSCHKLVLNDLWRSPNESLQNLPPPLSTKRHVPEFDIFEESKAIYQQSPKIQPKGSAMKTPFKILTDDDLAETGSRGGLDVATTAQPADGAKRLAMFDDDDDDSSGFGVALDTTNTELFNLNMRFGSTPAEVKASTSAPTDVKMSKKQLFPEQPNILSVILEEKSAYSSSGSSSTKTPSNLNFDNLNTVEEENSYYFNYSQNIKANAELRQQLLNSFSKTDSDAEVANCPIATYEVDDDDEEEEDQEEAIEDIGEIQERIPYSVLSKAPSDPFKLSVIEGLLQHVGFPGRHKTGYVVLNSSPKLVIRKEPYSIGTDRFIVEKMLGKGTYGSVFKATRITDNAAVALKIQKPPSKWEYYICRELQSRLSNNPIKDKFMNVYKGYFSDTNSVLLSDFCPGGSLLDVANLVRTKSGKSLKESLCIHFAIEMLNIIQAMHQVKIIHADIKPDNFLVTVNYETAGLQLIDFGCSIDMSLFPEGTMFSRRITTEDFVCCEMLEGKPWSYHTDLFCVAATIHVLLFGTYIQVKKTDNVWSITQKFVRYWRADLWNMFFSTLLNMSEGLPDIESLKQFLNGFINKKAFQVEMREVVNILKNR